MRELPVEIVERVVGHFIGGLDAGALVENARLARRSDLPRLSNATRAALVCRKWRDIVAGVQRRRFGALVFGPGRSRRLTCEEYRRLVPQFNPVLTRNLLEPAILRSILSNGSKTVCRLLAKRFLDEENAALFAEFNYSRKRATYKAGQFPDSWTSFFDLWPDWHRVARKQAFAATDPLADIKREFALRDSVARNSLQCGRVQISFARPIAQPIARPPAPQRVAGDGMLCLEWR